MNERRRLEIWERDEGTCQLCHRAGQEIHHVEAKKMGGRYGAAKERIESIDNLQLVCTACHYEIHHQGGKDNRMPNGFSHLPHRELRIGDHVDVQVRGCLPRRGMVWGFTAYGEKVLVRFENGTRAEYPIKRVQRIGGDDV